MFFYATLAVAAAAAGAVSATPVEARAPLAMPLSHVNNVKSIKSIVERGQTRIAKVNGARADAPEASSGAVTNEDVTYVAPVSIGGTTWQLIVDTGCTSII